MSTDQTESKHRSPAVRWGILLTTWVVAGIVQAVLWNVFSENRTTQIMSVYYVLPTTVFLSILWWLFLSPYSWNVRLAVFAGGLGALAVAAAVMLGLFVRFEGFWGGFIPQFSWRSEKTAEEKFLETFESPQPTTPVAAATGEQPVLTVQSGDWPQFRGTDRDGVAEEATIRRDWKGQTPRELWRKKVGPGWSSFCVVDGHIFTQMQIDQDECVVCYELETGEEIWVHRNKGVRFHEIRVGTGPNATPTFYDGKLYALGATGILDCLDPLTGEEIWQTNILKDAGVDNIEWGMAASPLAYDGKIVVNPGSDGEKPTGVAAYDASTGEKLWADGLREAAYTAPRLATVDGVQQVLIFDGYGLAGHDAQSGKRLWEFKWRNDFHINAALPIVRDDGAIFISTSYDVGSALVRAQKTADGWTAQTSDWETARKFKLKFGDGVKHENAVFALNETILSGFDLDAGRITWRKRGDFGFGQLLMVDDVLVILSEEGQVTLVDPLADGQPELLSFPAIEGKTWGHPAYVRGKLLVRNAAEMACFDLSP